MLLRKPYILILALLIATVPATISAAYTLTPGDTLEIKVIGHDELTSKQNLGAKPLKQRETPLRY